MTKQDEIKKKLQKTIDTECQYADRDGRSTLSVCDHYSWDQDQYNHRHKIVDAIRGRGYNVSISTKYGVVDIVTTPNIELK